MNPPTAAEPQSQRASVSAWAWLGTLKLRLMLLSAATIAVCVLATTTVLLHRVEARGKQAVLDLEIDHMQSLAALLGQRVLAMQRMLVATAKALPARAPFEAAVAREFLADKPGLSATFDYLFLADLQGQMLAVHDGKKVHSPVLNVAGRDYFMRTVSQRLPVVSSPMAGRLSHAPIIMLTAPVFGPQGQLVAVVGGSIRLDARNLLDDLTVRTVGRDDQSLTVVSDAQGVVVSHPDRRRLAGDVGAEPRLALGVARWVAQGRPVEPSADVLHADGQFITVVGVPGADWIVFRAVPDDALLGGQAQARRELYGWAVGLAGGGALLIMAVLTYLLGPLHRLRLRAQQMHNTDLPLDQGWPQASGEIGELSQVLQRALKESAQLGQAQAQAMQQMRSVMTAAPIGIGFTRGRLFELVGAEFNALLGWPDGALVGRPARDIFASEEEYDGLGPAVGAAFSEGKPYFGELQFRRRDGSMLWGRLQGRPVDPKDSAAGTIWLLEDVTQRRAERERLSWTASHDGLTRLLNRASFDQRLLDWLGQGKAQAQAQTQGPAQGAQVATLMLLDLDRFKQINDSAGHAAGDEVLRQVAHVLDDNVRGADAAARLGGDEFALLLPGCTGHDGMLLAARLCAQIAGLGVQHGERWLGIGASIGVVTMQPGLAIAAADWMARADAACYDAKHAGRGRACQAAPLPTLQLVVKAVV